MKMFFFVMQLLLADGTEGARTMEQAPDLVSCLSRVADVQSRMAEVNETFELRVACVQVSQKANPA